MQLPCRQSHFSVVVVVVLVVGVAAVVVVVVFFVGIVIIVYGPVSKCHLFAVATIQHGLVWCGSRLRDNCCWRCIRCCWLCLFVEVVAAVIANVCNPCVTVAGLICVADVTIDVVVGVGWRCGVCCCVLLLCC